MSDSRRFQPDNLSQKHTDPDFAHQVEDAAVFPESSPEALLKGRYETLFQHNPSLEADVTSAFERRGQGRTFLEFLKDEIPNIRALVDRGSIRLPKELRDNKWNDQW